MQQSIVKFYCFVVQTMLNLFRALQCPKYVEQCLYDKAIKFAIDCCI